MRPLPVMWAKQEARELTKQEELDYEARYTEWLDAQDKLQEVPGVPGEHGQVLLRHQGR